MAAAHIAQTHPPFSRATVLLLPLFRADCGYHDGFALAIAASVITGVAALLSWFWMPWLPPSASAGAAPTFSATASGGGASSSAYANIGEDPLSKSTGFNSA